MTSAQPIGAPVAPFRPPARPPYRSPAATALQAESAPSIALALRGVSLSFGGIQALRNVSFDVRPGEIRAVIGPNGAGKSSLMNIVSGLYTADEGQILLPGGAVRRMPVQRLAALGIARTFQNLALFEGLSVAQNIATGLAFQRQSGVLGHLLGLPRARQSAREEAARVTQIAAFLGLGAVLDRPVAALPYGVQKLVDLARALVAHPALLLLDEPMAGLTVAEKADLARKIAEVRAEYRPAIVLIEHDIGIVMSLSDRIAVLDHGEIIADGTPAEVRSNPAVIRAYLGADA